MSKQPDAFTRLTNALKVLPNVGPKSAQRMAHQLLQYKRTEAQELVDALQNALRLVHHCKMCNTFCEADLCDICADESRDRRRLMIVHMPADVSNMEIANCHDGLYFVLMGQISPAQGMDISAIALDKLVTRLQESEVEEIIIATNFTAEGDATAYILAELFKNLPYKVSRLSRGIPLGGELEYVDAGTLAQAVYERRLVKE
ncbi:recombination protein RecR [Neisseria chenwenguii]|uniref:Recombination protein RecR n=1 Tax=Neisseria chenwenguii TaxID=1853278 RepID=A0A220RYW9_9NEIS|nr:recombination mediator RecR [Neisseria chenwenguii]ASK26367.1 recombination protein RecR [Neisseria chenwenguii]